MKFINISIENFMSIKKTSFTFNNRGLVLITGENQDAFESNGAGKSTAFSEAPCWALFGETIRGYKGDKVVNKNTKKNTLVSLEIEDDNGDLYEVRRYRKHKEYKNHVLLFRNGENITGKSDKDTTQMIIDLIQMDYSTFTNSIMFGQGASKMFANSTDTEQKQILERMLQIDIFKACQEEAKTISSNVEERLNRLERDKENKYNLLSVHESNLHQLQEKEQQAFQQAEEKIKRYNQEILECEEALETLSSHITEYNRVIESLKEDQEKVQEKLDSFKEYEEAGRELISERASITKDIKKLQKKIQKSEKELRDLKEGKNVPKTCEYCGQDLPLEDTSHLENHLEKNINSLKEEVEELEEELDEIKPLLKKVEKKLLKKETYEYERVSLTKDIAEQEGSVKLAKSQQKNHANRIKELKSLIRDQEEAQKVQYTELIEKEISNIGEAKESIELLGSKIQKESETLEKYKFWASAFGNQGIKSILLDSVTPFLNKRANHYLSLLSDSTMEVEFNTQTTLANGEKRDKFSVEVINHNGEDGYKGSSNGEKRRIDISVNMALQDLVMSRSNKSIDLIVYDEVFEGLDQTGCEAVIELLNEKASQCGTVMVITHNDNLKQLFSNSISVTKVNGDTVVIDS